MMRRMREDSGVSCLEVDFGPECVLVADDDVGVRRYATWALQALGRSVSAYADAEESRSMRSSRKSRWARMAPITRAWCGSKRPSRASRKAGSFLWSLPGRARKSTSGSVVPATSASSIAHPETPQDVGDHAVQFDAGVPERLVQSVGLLATGFPAQAFPSSVVFPEGVPDSFR